jgi:hypothetical protein
MTSFKPRYFGASVPLWFVLAAAVAPTAGSAQTATTSETRPYVQTLASDRFEGREAGSTGERLAGEYIADQLARLGARPLPGRRDMFVPFEFTAGSRDGGSMIRVGHGTAAAPAGTVAGAVFVVTERADIQALSFSDDGEVTAPVVFAGYGIVVPESQNFGYDSYATLDVKDKIVVVLRYFPEDADKDTKATLARYSDLRYKAMAARQHGAKAIVVVTGPRSPNAGETVPMSFDTAIAGSGIPAASVSRKVADELFKGGPGLDSVQKDLDTGNPHVAGFELPTVTVTLKTSIVREKQTGRNVIAYIPATAPLAGVT